MYAGADTRDAVEGKGPGHEGDDAVGDVEAETGAAVFLLDVVVTEAERI